MVAHVAPLMHRALFPGPEVSTSRSVPRMPLPPSTTQIGGSILNPRSHRAVENRCADRRVLQRTLCRRAGPRPRRLPRARRQCDRPDPLDEGDTRDPLSRELVGGARILAGSSPRPTADGPRPGSCRSSAPSPVASRPRRAGAFSTVPAKGAAASSAYGWRSDLPAVSCPHARQALSRETPHAFQPDLLRRRLWRQTASAAAAAFPRQEAACLYQ